MFAARLAVCLTAFVIASTPAPALGAQEGAGSFDLSGSLRAGLWTHSRSLDGEGPVPAASAWAAADWRLNDTLSAHAEGWLRAEDRDDAQAYRHATVREAYVTATSGRWDLRLGKQIIAWGRADAINPTDSLIRRDYTLLVPEDADQREGLVALRLRYSADPFEITAVWAPEFQSSRIPLLPLPQVRYAAQEPPRRDQFALKIESSGGELEWSVSYFDGADAIPDLSLAAADAGGATIALTTHRRRVLGFDAGTTVGPYALRAEGAWAKPEGAPGDVQASKREQLSLVLGGDRNLTSTLNLNLQYFAQQVHGFRSAAEIEDPLLRSVAQRQAITANQTSAFQQGLTLRLGGRWWNDALEADTSLVYSFTDRARLWRAKAAYAIDDHWRVTAGFDLFRGSPDTFLGQLRENSTAFAELRRLF